MHGYQLNLELLHNISEKIQSTCENDVRGELPFLDTIIEKSGNELKYRVIEIQQL